MVNPANRNSKADRYLASYQKMCLFPFTAALLSLFATFLLYANNEFALNISFFLIRKLHLIGLEILYLWLIGMGIAFVFLFLTILAAKGKWYLLFIPLVLLVADVILGFTLFGQIDSGGMVVAMIIRFLFIFAVVFAIVMARLTLRELRKEKQG